MNGQSHQMESNSIELKRKANEESHANGKDTRPMARAEIKSPVKEPQKKKPKLATNDKVIRSLPRSALNSPKITSPSKDSKVSIKKEASTPTKQPHKKPSETTPTRSSWKAEVVSANNKKPTIKQESKLNSTKTEQPKLKPAESDSDDDVPLARRVNKVVDVKVKSEPKVKKPDPKKIVKKEKDGKPIKAEKKPAAKKPVAAEDESDDEPLSARVNKAKSSAKPTPKKPSSVKKTKPTSAERKRKKSESDSEDEPLSKVAKTSAKKPVKKGDAKKKVKTEKGREKSKTAVKKNHEKEGKGKKKKEEEKEVWKWWEEQELPEGKKWLHLEHMGPYFPPDYETIPDDVRFYYDGKPFKLSLASEEIAGFYAKMLEHEYTQKDIFNKNFFNDWRKEMSEEERKVLKDIKKCDFKEMYKYFDMKNEERKNRTKEQKLELKKENEAILNEYGFCVMDKHKQRVGNFKIEPPGLFRGRGDHPKQGKLKKRVMPEEVTINIGKDAKIPEPPAGHKWKKVISDNTVTWLACWIENIQGSYKYVMLNPTSRLKGEKDWRKYETARKLKTCVDKIRENYKRDWKSKEMRLRQRGVALYFIDKLALRAGHEKDDDTADTVGCCSLRVEHIKLHDEWEDKECVVEFDFLGKDSVRYLNYVPIEKRAYKNMKLFMEGKQDGDDLFDRLTTTSLNKYLSELMEGLSAKVFRTFNASLTLQDQLLKLTETDDNVNAKVLSYNRANRAVAILCNHQRTAPKTFEKSMSNLQVKISDKKKAIKDAKKELKDLRSKAKSRQSDANIKLVEKKTAQVKRLEEQLFKLEVTATDKEENKEIALGTSKLNYLDPRITVAWCKKFEVPIEKAYSKTHREKFAWAIDMAGEDFVF